MIEDWYPIYSIRFTKNQMWWLIENLGELKIGIYPSPYEILPDRQIRHYREPAQNRVLELAAEVECRLDLVMSYISGWPRPTKKIKRQTR